MQFYRELKEEFKNLLQKNTLLKEDIEIVSARSLTAEEAIGNPGRDDFPIIKGREVMMQAEFKNAKGQSFTDTPGNFKGNLQEVLKLNLKDNFERAVFAAAFNAAARFLGIAEKTIHCRDQEPKKCSQYLAKHIKERFGNPKIAFVGLQPAMIDELSKEYSMRVTDLDADNIGKTKNGILIEDAANTQDILIWGDIILATGSTLVNNTLPSLLVDKPIIFYGVTAAGAAKIKGFENYCYCGH